MRVCDIALVNFSDEKPAMLQMRVELLKDVIADLCKNRKVRGTQRMFFQIWKTERERERKREGERGRGERERETQTWLHTHTHMHNSARRERETHTHTQTGLHMHNNVHTYSNTCTLTHFHRVREMSWGVIVLTFYFIGRHLDILCSNLPSKLSV